MIVPDRECLQRRKKNPVDVFNVQLVVNAMHLQLKLKLPALLVIDGECGPQTTEAIKLFQTHYYGWKDPDGRVSKDGKTIHALNQVIVPRIAHLDGTDVGCDY